MSYDDAVDPVVQYLRLALSEAANRALLGTFGTEHPAVRTTRGHQLALESLASSELPQLGVYVETEQSLVKGRRGRGDAALSMVIEYTAPSTPLKKLDGRWPMLRCVWRALSESLATGKIDDVCWGEPIGLTWHNPNEDRVEYTYATDGESAYPHFRAVVRLEVRDGMNLADLYPAFESLGLRIFPDGVNPERQPLVEGQAPR